MIVASQFGWSAVSREPMDWTEYHLARQLMAEERVGKHQRAAVAQEDAEFSALLSKAPHRG